MNQGSGLRTFAFVAALVLALSWVRLDHSGTRLGTGPGGSPGSEVAAGDFSEDGDFLDEEAAVEGAAATGPSGGAGRRVTSGGTAGTAGSGGTAGRAGGTPGGGTAGAPAGGGSGSGGTGGGTSGGGAAVGGGQSGGSSAGTNSDGSPIECKAGKNGGATDVGVTATEIKLATTAVLDGQAATLLAPSVTGIKAVFNTVNAAGGICGRRLSLKVDNDSFDKSRGQQIIKNYIEGGIFALPVVPSAEGLGAAIESGDISKAGIPVIGTDGMRQEQYTDPWVWPVAVATTSTMRVMAKYGFDKKNARKFAIVWDGKYKFGVEGRDAFKAQVEAMGGTIVEDRQLEPTQPSYGSEVGLFNAACGDGKCDMVAMLLLPDTAKQWLKSQPALGGLYTAGAQTLFTDGFAQDCVSQVAGRCNGFAVWTGYNPPIGAIASKPGVAAYKEEVRALNSTIDVNNQFLQGAYLGATVFVEALKKAGPNLTRAGLREAMDSMDHQTDLSSPLSWRVGKHRANISSQSFTMAVSNGTFQGWSAESGFRTDPKPEN